MHIFALQELITIIFSYVQHDNLTLFRLANINKLWRKLVAANFKFTKCTHDAEWYEKIHPYLGTPVNVHCDWFSLVWKKLHGETRILNDLSNEQDNLQRCKNLMRLQRQFANMVKLECSKILSNVQMVPYNANFMNSKFESVNVVTHDCKLMVVGPQGAV